MKKRKKCIRQLGNWTGFHNRKKTNKTYYTFSFEVAAAFARSAICPTHADWFRLAALVSSFAGEDKSGEKSYQNHGKSKEEKKNVTTLLMNSSQFLGDDRV